jgi:hypothetical protein
MRQDNEPPQATSQWGWRYHHIGIPTTRRMPGETYLPAFKLYKGGLQDNHRGSETYYVNFSKYSNGIQL